MRADDDDPVTLPPRLAKSLAHPVEKLSPRRRPSALRKWYVKRRSRLAERIHGRGLQTAGLEFGVDHFHPEWAHYEPSGWSYLSRALPRRKVSSADVFVDLGCGKGRVVIQAAAAYPFRRVIGVEIATDLLEVAHANVRAAGDRLQGEIELVQADAAEWVVPDDLTVAYLYHPFSGATLSRVLENLVASVDRAPRRLRLVYACPLGEDEVMATGRFEVVRTVRPFRIAAPPWDIRVYEATTG